MREPAFWHAPKSWKSHLLRPLGALYGAIAAQRLQRQGFDAGVPVFCVGNYHVGGAGKTPAVLALRLRISTREMPTYEPLTSTTMPFANRRQSLLINRVSRPVRLLP